jgi:hypothetical protein
MSIATLTDLPPHWLGLSRWLNSWSQPNGAFLERAYDADLKKHVSYEAFGNAQLELTADLRHFPRYEWLARTEPKLAQALILLHAGADGKERKFNHTRLYLHTLEVGEDFFDVTRSFVRAPQQMLEAGIQIALHDGIEDCGMTPEVINELFGASARERTQLVTSPEISKLALHFLDITERWTSLPEGLKIDNVRKHLKELKEKNPGTYEALKSDLKIAHKREIAAKYTLIEAVYRAIDNAHSLRSYAKDINRGILYVVSDEKESAPLNSKPIRIDEIRYINPKPISIDEIRYNIANRTLCNDAILERFKKMQKGASTPGITWKSWKTQQQIKRAKVAVKNYFNSARNELETALEKAAAPSRNDPPGMQQRLLSFVV